MGGGEGVGVGGSQTWHVLLITSRACWNGGEINFPSLVKRELKINANVWQEGGVGGVGGGWRE